MSKPVRLKVALVPKGCWFSNVRSHVSAEDWAYLRRRTLKRAGHRCECCRDPRTQGALLHCHEVFHYKGGVQKLMRLVALCEPCHEVKHLGLAQARGRLDPALRHLARVNGWARAYAVRYARRCFELWRERSGRSWKLDLMFLDGLGVKYKTTKTKKG